MSNATNIRNISVIGHQKHGKSTLANTLAFVAGISPHEDEKDRDITIKPTIFPLYFEIPPKDQGDITQGINGSVFLINLVDSPGHVDLLPETTAALGITDGALVVIDCIEGICNQARVMLRQTLIQRIKPVAVINKIDRVFDEFHYSKEDLYQSFKQTVESVNTIISTFSDKTFSDLMVHPEKGSVAFASGLQGWASIR
ncbi:Elongation factor 2 [Modicella reniformis]|uniref:Elongation factor 2 n=1 Tax=Modicella reniformis TaxID=1440133 RepID=A0A9P6IW94_9FUNG|nr:Elongation factor 2 [Modicella reniformis]